MVEAYASGGSRLFDAYGVGSVHPYSHKLPSQTGMVAQYMPGGISLHLMLGDCTDGDVQAWRTSERKFGLLPLRGGYVWLMNDSVAAWDAPYCPGIEPPENQKLHWSRETFTQNTRAGISLVLVDGRRIVRALKYVSVSPDFTRRLDTAHARALADAPASRAGWDTEIGRYFRAYPNPKAAFRHAITTCRGGD